MTNIKNQSVSEYLNLIHSFYKEMIENGFNVIYEGEITHMITKTFASLSENNLEKEMEDRGIRKKVFHVMVECLQNIYKHAYDEEYIGDYTTGNGIFIVGQYEHEYHVITGNKVAQENIEWMSSLFDKINTLDKDGINALYKKALIEGHISERGGAGLGFIDIVRKTGNKLDYHFEKINDKVSYFILKTIISRN